MKKALVVAIAAVVFMFSGRAFAYNEANGTAFYMNMPSLVQYYQLADGGSKIVFGNLSLLDGRASIGVKQYVYRDLLSGTHFSFTMKVKKNLDASIYTTTTQVAGGDPTSISHTTSLDYQFKYGTAVNGGVGVIAPLSKGGVVRVTGRVGTKKPDSA